MPTIINQMNAADFAAYQLSPRQVDWARAHDWFISATRDGVITVADRVTWNGRLIENQIIWGGSFSELRDWAGY